MQLDVLHLQGVGLAVAGQLAGGRDDALDEVVCDLQQHLRGRDGEGDCVKRGPLGNPTISG